MAEVTHLIIFRFHPNTTVRKRHLATLRTGGMFFYLGFVTMDILFMQKQFPTWVLALLGVILGIAQGIATYWHLYFYIWWLDIPMHILGGFWIALFVLSYSYGEKGLDMKDNSVKATIIVGLMTTFIIGVGWEIFERLVDQINNLNNFDFVDTISDICNDVIGASLATTLFVRMGYNRLYDTKS